MAVLCEQDNEPFVSIKDVVLLKYLSDYHHLKNNFAPYSNLHLC